MLFEKIQLEKDEKIVKIINKHWFIVFSHAMSLLLVGIAPLIAWVAASIFIQQDTSLLKVDLVEYTTYFIYFYALWILLNWMTFAHLWTTYHLDVWVITTRRVIVIDQISLFKRKIGSFRLERLQDVNIEINGIIATFLDFGTIECETASGSHDAEFRTKNLPSPRDVKSAILSVADARMQETNQSRNI